MNPAQIGTLVDGVQKPLDSLGFDDWEPPLRVGSGWQITRAQTPLAIDRRPNERFSRGIMGQPALWSHRLTLAPQAACVLVARVFVRARLLEHELSVLVDDIRLVVSELATNAALHARTPFTVQLEGDERSVRLTVSDGLLLLPIRVSAAPMASGGRGLDIVAACSRDWGVTEAAPTRSPCGRRSTCHSQGQKRPVPTGETPGRAGPLTRPPRRRGPATLNEDGPADSSVGALPRYEGRRRSRPAQPSRFPTSNRSRGQSPAGRSY